MSSLLKLISSFSELNHERGKQWEVACKWFLENDPIYKAHPNAHQYPAVSG
jgi:hypothetical protein